jgi:hypothetical protein
MWDFRFSRRRVWRWLSSGLLRRVVWYEFTHVSGVLDDQGNGGGSKHLWYVTLSNQLLLRNIFVQFTWQSENKCHIVIAAAKGSNINETLLSRIFLGYGIKTLLTITQARQIITKNHRLLCATASNCPPNRTWFTYVFIISYFTGVRDQDSTWWLLRETRTPSSTILTVWFMHSLNWETEKWIYFESCSSTEFCLEIDLPV